MKKKTYYKLDESGNLVTVEKRNKKGIYCFANIDDESLYYLIIQKIKNIIIGKYRSVKNCEDFKIKIVFDFGGFSQVLFNKFLYAKTFRGLTRALVYSFFNDTEQYNLKLIDCTDFYRKQAEEISNEYEEE